MKSKFFLIQFFLVFQIFAQIDEVKFKNILPSEVYNNSELFENAMGVIMEEAKLNPELIYYRIAFYNEMYKNKNLDIKTNGLEELNNAKTKYIIERNNYIDNKIKEFELKYEHDDYSSSVKSYLEDFRIYTNRDSFVVKPVSEVNIMNFYVAFFISKGGSEFI